MVAVIGKAGRNISKADAESHVVGYSVFNEGSIRDYQFKGPQWTLGQELRRHRRLRALFRNR